MGDQRTHNAVTIDELQSGDGGCESSSISHGSASDASDGVPALVRRLLATVTGATAGLPRQTSSAILEAAELLAVTALHAHSTALEATEALARGSRAYDVDALTKLPNRMLFRDRFAQAIAYAKRRNSRIAVLFVDLDNFKEINDRYGHGIGDELLRHVGQCLNAAGRDVDTVSRHGGDEFLILLSDANDQHDPAAFAEKALEALATPLRIGDLVVQIGASIGIAMYPDDGEEQEDLVRRADAAMYFAKRNGLRIAFAAGTYGRGTKSSSVSPDPQRSDPIELIERALSEANRRHAEQQAVIVQQQAALDAASDSAQRAEAAKRYQADLLHIVAHELRSTLTPLQTALDVLVLTHSDTSLLPRFELILSRQVERISKIVSDILDVSRVNNGRAELQYQRLDLGKIIGERVAAKQAGLSRRGQHLTVDSPAAPLMINGDASRVSEIISALIDRASTGATDGATLYLTCAERSAHAVVGVEYPHDHMERLGAGPLSSPDGAAAAIGGDGELTLSLLVVMEFVKLHGGRLALTCDRDTLRTRLEVLFPLSS